MKTIERIKNYLTIPPNCIVVGDFNEHHPDWDPYSPRSTNAEDLKFWFEEQGLSLMNKIGKGTFYKAGMELQSVLDLTLASESSGKP